ncbi:nucleotidyltransferase family protein [Rhodoflexus sp.]
MWLFGFYARGEQDETSDLDILLQCEPVSYFKLHDLIEELKAAFPLKVDLVTAGGVSRHIQPYIDKDKILFYEKPQGFILITAS